MILLCLFGCGCGAGKSDDPGRAARAPFQQMSGCEMEADIVWNDGMGERNFTLRCAYTPEGVSTVEILAPEEAAGVRASVDGQTMQLLYDGVCLPVVPAAGQISPAGCLPQLMEALREGWLLEENREKLDGTACLRLGLDRTEADGKKAFFGIWLDEKSGIPCYAEISVNKEIILRAEFTKFEFRDILKS